MTKLTVMVKCDLSEEEWQAAGDELVEWWPPVNRPKPKGPSSVQLYVEAFFRAAKKKAPQPKGTYNPLTRRRH